MPARRPTLNRRVLQAALPALLVVLSGCAGALTNNKPGTPDESALAPAQQALAKARAAHADDFAPRDIDAARRRITLARDILFHAARADRPLTATERERLQQLVSGAQLDARAALTKSQAGAEGAKIEQLQAQLNPQLQNTATQGVQSGSQQHSALAPRHGTPLNPRPRPQEEPQQPAGGQSRTLPPPGPQGAPGPGRRGGPLGADQMGVR